MKLTLSVIREYLDEKFSILDSKIINKNLFIQNVLFTNGTIDLSPDNIYIYNSEYPIKSSDLTSEIAILNIGPISKEMKTSEVNYISVIASANPLEIFNAVSILFEKLRNWESQIYNMLIMGNTLQEIFNASTEYTNNPIYLHDKNYHILAYAERSIDHSKQKSYSFLKNGAMPPEAVLGLLKSPKFESTFSTDHATYWEKTSIYPDEYNYIYCNIKLNGQFVGRIFMDERNRPFRQIDYIIVDKLAELVTKMYQTKKLIAKYHLDYLENSFCELLGNSPTNHKEFLTSLSEIGWNVTDHYYCITIPLSESDSKKHITGSVLSVKESRGQPKTGALKQAIEK